MTKEDIKKALKCCVKHVYCKGCPYRGNQQCIGKTQQDALALITEQESEIKQLKAENEKRLTCDFVKSAQKQAQIDVLNKVKNCREATDSDCYPYLERIVNKLIKEVQND